MKLRNRFVPRIEMLEDRYTPAIRLDLVTLHELGHALGLDHTNNVGSIMDPYYNANYNLANFASDPAVATFRSLFNNVSTSSWKDSLDPSPGNGRVDITYSYMPDGNKLDSNKANQIFAKFNAIFGSASVWQNVINTELNRWASVSNGKVAFVPHSDNGANFNATGAVQNDSRFGDIRIGAHRFDGSGKVLAHTYFPPPNGATAAGDMHFDFAEDWVLAPGASFGNLSSGISDNEMHYFHDHEHEHDHGEESITKNDGNVAQTLLATSEVTDTVFVALTTNIVVPEIDTAELPNPSPVNDIVPPLNEASLPPATKGSGSFAVDLALPVLALKLT